MEELWGKFYEPALNEEIPAKDGELVVASNEVTQAGCNCVAHQSELEWVYKLIDVPEPLTDDWGCKLANTLLSIIFRQAGLFQLDVEDVRQGSPHIVNYVLQLPSGETGHFTGWPDFTITRRFTPSAEWRILSHYTRRATRLQGVGEVQSPRGDTLESKTATVSQCGVYGVGQLATSRIRKVVAIILFKDKSAQVAIASITNATSNPLENSIGEVNYKFEERVDSTSLKIQEEFQEFCRILVSALKWTAR